MASRGASEKRRGGSTSRSSKSPQTPGRSAAGPSSIRADPTARSPYLYIPNLIGYARILLVFVAMHYAFTDYRRAAACYFLSAFLDAFDGMAARAFSQTSQLGAVLDMVTDRFSTNVLLAVLAHLYVDYAIFCFFLMVLDIVSHWTHMYASLLTGSGSHKDMSNSNFLIRLYYQSKPVLFTVCMAEQLVYFGLYLMYFTSDTGLAFEDSVFHVASAIALFAAPLHVFKQGMNFLQLYYACEALNEWDLRKKRT